MGDNDTVDKREARRLYKEKKTPIGILAVKCSATGETWVGSSTHLDTHRNSLWFQLRMGSFLNRRLQESWNAHGEAAFDLEILETLDEDIEPLLVKDTLAARQKQWANELKALNL